jgi:hypothetical protein
MKLDEIVLIGGNLAKGFNTSNIDLASGQQINTAENIPLWKYDLIRGNQIAYALKVGEKLACIIVGVPLQLDKVYFQIQRTWTIPEFRGKGYAPALYIVLVRKCHLALISDKEQTIGGKKIWDKIKTMITVRVFDNKTRQFVDGISDDEVYSSDRYFLIAEQQEIFENAILKQHGEYVDNSKFEQRIISMLDDYIIFT